MYNETPKQWNVPTTTTTAGGYGLDTPPRQSAVGTQIDRLRSLRTQAESLAERTTALADTYFGSAPTPATNQNIGKGVGPSSLMSDLNAENEMLSAALAHLSTAVDRLSCI